MLLVFTERALKRFDYFQVVLDLIACECVSLDLVQRKEHIHGDYSFVIVAEYLLVETYLCGRIL